MKRQISEWKVIANILEQHDLELEQYRFKCQT